MDTISIKEISPLFDFWNSDQNQEDNKKRLLKANQNSSAASLFINEPYKWEILFQSILSKIIRGDQDLLRALSVMLSTLSPKEKNKVLNKIQSYNIFTKDMNDRLISIDSHKKPLKSNPYRFLSILYAIFTNPYNIDLKLKKRHVYEKSGEIFLILRRFLKLI